MHAGDCSSSADGFIVNGLENNSKNNCDYNSRSRRRSSIKNPHIEDMKEDVLFHLGLSTLNDDLRIMFGDVKHGIGSPSISIVLHEILKLVYHAGAENPVFLRIGTSGGLGIPPGSVVITNVSVNGMLKPYQELVILGQKVQRPSVLDEELCKELKMVGDKHLTDCTAFVGKTMCADDFYEGQGRLDGAFCEYNKDDKLSYLKKLKAKGVLNIEMESLTFAAMCCNAGLKGGVICVTLLDRLKDDQVTASEDDVRQWEKRAVHLAAMYIKENLT